jgi:predicted aldo/keto reductase-like oxidoreductase
MYGRFFDEAERADKCAQCGECEKKCPQGIEISKLMPEIHEKLK